MTKGWANTDGGRGGRIIPVTSLASYGPGTLREAINATGARIIVFETSGVIDLGSERLRISAPYVSIAGQTAPSPGITLIKGGIEVATHDVIIQHLRVRSGEAGHAKGSGFSMNPIWTVAGAENVIIDHCTTSWASDENLTVAGWGQTSGDIAQWRAAVSRNVTLSQNIVAESLLNSTNAAAQAYGTLVMDNASGILVYGNFYAHNNARNPEFKGGAHGAIVNNLTYNPRLAFLSYTLQSSEWEVQGFVAPYERGKLSAVGNVARAGPSTTLVASYFTVVSNGDVEYYGRDNVATRSDGSAYPQVLNSTYLGYPLGTAIVQGTANAWPSGLVAMPASEVETWVYQTVGARPWDRDAHDTRVLNDWKNRTGRIIDSELDVGGYPPNIVNTRKFDASLWNLDSMTPRSVQALW